MKLCIPLKCLFTYLRFFPHFSPLLPFTFYLFFKFSIKKNKKNKVTIDLVIKGFSIREFLEDRNLSRREMVMEMR